MLHAHSVEYYLAFTRKLAFFIMITQINCEDITINEAIHVMKENIELFHFIGEFQVEIM